MALLRSHEVLKRTGLSRMTLWRLEKTGQFPRRRQLGCNSVAWLEEEVTAWERSRPLAATSTAPSRVSRPQGS